MIAIPVPLGPPDDTTDELELFGAVRNGVEPELAQVIPHVLVLQAARDVRVVRDARGQPR